MPAKQFSCSKARLKLTVPYAPIASERIPYSNRHYIPAIPPIIRKLGLGGIVEYVHINLIQHSHPNAKTTAYLKIVIITIEIITPVVSKRPAYVRASHKVYANLARHGNPDTQKSICPYPKRLRLCVARLPPGGASSYSYSCQ